MAEEKKNDVVEADSKYVLKQVEELQQWLIGTGAQQGGVKPFLAAYFHTLRRMGIEVDMIFGGGVLLSEYTPGYIWTCEDTEECCNEIEISREYFKIYTSSLQADDPFVILRERQANSVRLTKGVHAIPEKSCPWYAAKKLTDYYALPILCNRGTFRGGFAWATKQEGGFSRHQIAFLETSMPAFAATMRLQTNDKIMESLTDRVEHEITNRTTDLLFANQELEEANTRIKQQAAAQLEHFAGMSHEVRTPLNCILGLSSMLLEDDDLTAEQRDTIELITSSGNLLRGVVDDVLDYTKLAAGHLEIRMEDCNLQDIVLQSIKLFSGQCHENQLTVQPTVAPNVPVIIRSDPRRLSQVLYNLIGNAVKYSKQGSTIDLKLAVNEDQVLCLSVKDYGKGIDKVHLDKIFEAFYQTDTDTAQHTYGGTGLGLSIASKIVKGLGGTISADSEVGQWCEFKVELPLKDTLHVNVEDITKRFQDVSVATILPDAEREQIVAMCRPFGVQTKVLASCKDLYDLTSVAKACVLVCHNDYYDSDEIQDYKRWEGERRVTVVTCGSDEVEGRDTDGHYQQLSMVFPSSLMSKLGDLFEGKLSTRPSRRPRVKPEEKPAPAPAPPPAQQATESRPMFPLESPTETKPMFETQQATEVRPMFSIQQQQQQATEVKPMFSTQPQQAMEVKPMFSTQPQQAAEYSTQPQQATEVKPMFSTRPSPRSQPMYSDEPPPETQAMFDIQPPRPTKVKPVFPTKQTSDRMVVVSRQNPEKQIVNEPLYHHPHQQPSSDSQPLFATATPISQSQQQPQPTRRVAVAKEASAAVRAPRVQHQQPKAAASNMAAAAARQPKSYEDLKVLITEDNRINQKVLHKALSRLGLQNVEIVENGAQAVNVTAEKEFDLIFMDIQMPVMDGLEATKLITTRRDKSPMPARGRSPMRSAAGKHDLPNVVFLSAHATEAYRERAAKVGGDGFIAKPFQLPKIKDALQSVLADMQGEM